MPILYYSEYSNIYIINSKTDEVYAFFPSISIVFNKFNTMSLICIILLFNSDICPDSRFFYNSIYIIFIVTFFYGPYVSAFGLSSI